uniref:Integrase catalytic domain-containing protein n=1 Tax=Chenopodium quinoa TaxID=63459 RepID=A0A803M4N9_CHEQI
MAAQDSLNQQSISAAGYTDKYFLGSGDQPDQHLGAHKFNGDNFLTWNRAIRLVLGAKNKLCFIDGTCRRPDADSSDLQKWIRNDYMVQSWLLNSMEKIISEGFILQQSANQLYEEIVERYGQFNAPQLFDLHKKLISIEQDSDSIVQYYSKLKRVWDEIQLLEGFPDCDCGALAHCTCGILKKILAADQKQKLIQFLAGLDRDYDAAKTNIINMDPFPTVYPTLVAKFKHDSYVFQDSITSQVKAVGVKQAGLYKFTSPSFSSSNKPLYEDSSSVSCHVSSSRPKLSLLHSRLAHKHPFPISSSHASCAFELIHVDLWGPYRHSTLSGAHYFLTILDDFSRVTWTHLVHNKTQVPAIVKGFLAYVENQFSSFVKTIRSDNGTEIIQDACSVLFSDKGIVHHRSFPGVPQQNSRVERKHIHLLETTRALKFHASLPIRFWGDCLLAATYLINLMPSSVLHWKTPYEVLMKKLPVYDHLRVIGCLCYAAHKTSDKFARRAKKCIFLGYPYGQKGYKLYDLESRKIILSRDVIFFEEVFPFKSGDSSLIESSDSFQHGSMVNPVVYHPDIPPFPIIQDSSEATVSSSSDSVSNTQNNLKDLSDSSVSIPVLEVSDLVHSDPPILRRSSRPVNLSSKLEGFIVPSTGLPGQASSSGSSSFNAYVCPVISSFYKDQLPSLANLLSHVDPASYNQAKQDPVWVRENVESGFLKIHHVCSAEQLADIMTKPLGAEQHLNLTLKLGIVVPDSSVTPFQLEGGM